MNKKIILASLSVLLSASVSADVLISEVFESNGGIAKFVELHNSGAAVDFSVDGWQLRRYSNGGTTPTTVTLTGVIPAGGFYVVGPTDVNTLFGAGTVDQVSTSINHNGNDKYDLFNGTSVVDSFGVDRIGGTDTFASNVVAHRVASQLPNDGSWGVTTPTGINAPSPKPNDPSPTGFWETTIISGSNANATMVATPGADGGAGGTELPVELENFSVE